jgi:hypothetical protein
LWNWQVLFRDPLAIDLLLAGMASVLFFTMMHHHNPLANLLYRSSNNIQVPVKVFSHPLLNQFLAPISN